MKQFNIHITLLLILTLFSCRVKTDLTKLQKNGMNFPEMKRHTFKKISYLKPKMLDIGYSSNYILSSTYETFQNYELNLFFSTELFDKVDAESFLFSFDDEEVSFLDAVHNYYIAQKIKSLHSSETSLKKKIPNSYGINGFVQVIHGKSDERELDASYFIATIEINETYYIFQLIGKKDNMGYLYDDFLNILSSIEE